jgi:hypothetical protein
VSWLILSFAIQHADAREETRAPQQSTWLSTGRLVDGRWHLGIRPAFELDPEGGMNWGLGASLQITLPVL